ncbi:hypothetical protein [Lysinibacillus sp. FSL W8-0953]|uniref:hypothetical protein n=1 Tax=Lysinibacillus sp. FSL W8-0953 TaxID=2954640 RepID=UPI0030F9F5C8
MVVRLDRISASKYTNFAEYLLAEQTLSLYYFTGIVNWGIAIPVSIGSIVGSFLGLKIIPYIQTRWVQIILPIIFLFLIGQVVSDLIK